MPRVSKKQNEIDTNKVLDAILRNPSADVELVATVCGLSTQQVYRVLRYLEDEKIIFGTPMMLDLSKLGKKRFIILAKRGFKVPNDISLRSATYSEEFLNSMAKEKIDIIPEDDYTCTGEYDMITTVIASDSHQVNKYTDFLRNVSAGYFSSFTIVEVLFTTRRNMKMTPDIDNFIDYINEVSSYSNRFIS